MQLFEKTDVLSVFSVIQFSKISLREYLSKLNRKRSFRLLSKLLRKEVIHPHLPVRIPCYDLTLIIGPTLDGSIQ